nr:PREDICTED: G2/M phase-specific E3 ubiquitin-protein ligase-like [Bemisia tabaci]
MYERIRGPLYQLMSGLNQETNLLDHIQKAPDAFYPLFCRSKEPQKLDAQKFYNLFSTYASTPQEERVLANWQCFLQEVEDNKSPVNFADILIFATADEKIPSLGYLSDRPKPRISFIEGVNPTASACFNHLRLPLDNFTYESFKENLQVAFLKCSRFDRS